MEKYIRYKRYHETLNESEIPVLLDDLIKQGWEIIHYSETKTTNDPNVIYANGSYEIIMILGRKQSDIL